MGFGQYRVEEDALVFTEFAMSCRVAGKFAESTLFSHLLKAENRTSGIFRVVKTKKNTLLRNTLESIGFHADADTADQISYRFTAELKNSHLVNMNSTYIQE